MREHIDRLCERGAAYPDLFEEIEEFRDSVGESSSAVTFQLPYPLDIAFSDYIGKGNRSDIRMHLRFMPSVTVVDERMRRTVHRKGHDFEPKSSNKLIEYRLCCTNRLTVGLPLVLDGPIPKPL